MCARPREPIDLIKAKGKKHLTEEEYETRKAQELDVPFTDIFPPTYLKRAQKDKFMEIADKLTQLGIMTELDVDVLAMYIISFDLYLEYTKQMGKYLREGNLPAVGEVQKMQDKAFRQAHTAARSLGLTITDRCRIVIPVPPDNDDDEL